MFMQSYFAVPGEPSSLTLMVTGLLTLGIYLVATGKLRAMRSATATEMTAQTPLPVGLPPIIQPERSAGEPSRMLDTLQAAVSILRGSAELEETQEIERELSACLAAAETRIAELDAMISASDEDAPPPPLRKLETEKTEVASR